MSRVLVIEDDRGVADGVVDILRMEGHDGLWSSGAHALEEALLYRPDIILLDLHMPPPDGFEVASQLAADARTKTIPIVIFTARNDPWDAVRRVGAAGTLIKPFDIEDLLRTVERAARGSDVGRCQSA